MRVRDFLNRVSTDVQNYEHYDISSVQMRVGDVVTYEDAELNYSDYNKKLTILINKEEIKSINSKGINYKVYKHKLVYDPILNYLVFYEYKKPSVKLDFKCKYHKISEYCDEAFFFQQELIQELPFDIQELNDLFLFYKEIQTVLDSIRENRDTHD